MKKCILFIPLAFMAAVSSCTQAEPEVTSTQEYYTRAFVKTFGVIDPTHTWGFGSPVKSREADPNATGWIRPHSVTEQERDLVMAYVRSNNNGNGMVTTSIDPADFENYFVSHVGQTEHTYTDGDGHQFIGCDAMDLFLIREFDTQPLKACDDWTAVNDFNKGENTDFDGDMLMKNSGALDFAYRSSHGSSCYVSNYIIIAGESIDPSLKGFHYLCFDYEASGESVQTRFDLKFTNATNGSTEITVAGTYDSENKEAWPAEEAIRAAIVEKESGRNIYDISKVSFIATADGNTRFNVEYTYESGVNTTNIVVDGGYSRTDKSGWPTDEEFIAFMNRSDLSHIVIKRDLTSVTGYVNGNQFVEPSGSYDDWVIRLVGKAVPVGTPIEDIPYAYDDSSLVDPDPDPDDPTPNPNPDPDDPTPNPNPDPDPDPDPTPDPDPDPTPDPTATYWRIMAEDLSVSANYNTSSTSSDWDFNDIVIDVVLDENGKADIWLRALGGIHPVFIEDPEGHRSNELHRYFRQNSNVIINTGGFTLNPVSLTNALQQFTFKTNGAPDYNAIKLFVEINGEEKELKAVTGQAPSKICVPATVQWCREQTHILRVYPKFSGWVGDQTAEFWK